MFLFFHLFTGAVVGFLLDDRLRTHAAIVPCILGALLPDLVDKPLGLLLLAETIGGGRIYLHTLLLLAALLVAGGAVYARYRRPGLLALAVGVGTHQALDLMWEQPQDWLYPFLGPFSQSGVEGWFLRAFLSELQNPVEWVSGLLLCLVLLPLVVPRAGRWLERRAGPALRTLALAAVPALVVAGLFALRQGLTHRYTPLTGWHDPQYNVLGGLVILLAALAALRFSRRGYPLDRPQIPTAPIDPRS